MKMTSKISNTDLLFTDMFRTEHSDSPIISIIFPKDGKFRSRKVVSRSRARPTQKFPSLKMNRMIQSESCNELNAYRLLDANSDVIAFYEQPMTIRYIQDDDIHIHYPDTLVQFRNHLELWEIKTAREAVKPELIQRTQLLENALTNFGYRYRLIIAEDLSKQPRLSNALTLLRFGRNPVSPLAEEQLRQIFEATNSSIRWDSIFDRSMRLEDRKLIYRLVLDGVLTFDIGQPLSNETNFSWAKEKEISWRI